MKIRKLLLFLLAAGVLIVSVGCAKSPNINRDRLNLNTDISNIELINKDELKIAIASDNQPFEYFKSVQPTGIDVDLAYQIASDLGCHITFQNMDFDQVLNTVKEGKADIALSAITVNPEREQIVNFSIPYYEDTLVFVDKKDNHINPNNVDNILQQADTKVVVQQGSTCEKYMKEKYPNVKIVSKATNDDCFNTIKSNEATLMLNEETYSLNKLSKEFEVVKYTDEHEKYAVAVGKDKQVLLDAINEIIKTRTNDGTLSNIAKAYL